MTLLLEATYILLILCIGTANIPPRTAGLPGKFQNTIVDGDKQTTKSPGLLV